MNGAVYITGRGIISAIGNNCKEVERALLDEETGIGDVRILKTAHRELPCGEVRLTDDQLRTMLDIPGKQICNRTALLGMEAVRQAVEESRAPLDGAFLISGTTVGGMDYTERHFTEMLDNDDYLPLLAMHDSGSTTGLIADYFKIEQKNAITISTACSSSANAIILGARMIKSGLADVVIAGGSEALSLFHLNGFNALMILDTERCRPFDDTRRGLNLGEGAAFVVLESEKSIRSRKARPFAQLSGYGNACDAFHQTASSECGEGAYLAMKEAIEMSGVHNDEIDYINAHGTGTPNNDASESAALKRLFGEKIPPVSSTKAFTGHTTSASGSIESVICLIALEKGFIPANLGWKTKMADGITPVQKTVRAQLRHIMCNSFGFGGNDSSLIISKTCMDSHIGPIPEIHANDVSYSILSTVNSTPEHPVDNIREFIPPMESRRLCKLLKTAISTSLTALRDAGIERPDAIIVGTSYGMLENSEKFLLQMCREGEHGLSPTLFMQSTHNTVAGTLAIHTKCHGYNITYTGLDKQEVMELCLRDATLLLRQSGIKNVLIGYHNEITPILHDMLYRLSGKEFPEGVTSVAMVIEKR